MCDARADLRRRGARIHFYLVDAAGFRAPEVGGLRADGGEGTEGRREPRLLALQGGGEDRRMGEGAVRQGRLRPRARRLPWHGRQRRTLHGLSSVHCRRCGRRVGLDRLPAVEQRTRDHERRLLSGVDAVLRDAERSPRACRLRAERDGSRSLLSLLFERLSRRHVSAGLAPGFCRNERLRRGCQPHEAERSVLGAACRRPQS